MIKSHNTKKIWVSWSSGKDCAFALYYLQNQKDKQNKENFQVQALLTTLNESFHRVAMHSTRRKLLEAQSQALGIPLREVLIPYPCTNEIYEEKMKENLSLALKENIEAIMFGDLFLEDVRKYRENQLKDYPIKALFPLWGFSTSDLAVKIIDEGFKAIITCIDPRKLPPSFCGRTYDKEFLRDLPHGIDPCGENGEFHTFTYDAPLFKAPILIKKGQTVNRDGFIFTDLTLLNE